MLADESSFERGDVGDHGFVVVVVVVIVVVIERSRC
jgi:hypothetical protein